MRFFVTASRAACSLASVLVVGLSVTASEPVIDGEAVTRINATLDSFVEAGAVVGVSALIYEGGDEVYFGAFGMADEEAGLPMSRDTIVQIFSMTKPITGVALMQLQERGLFELDDDVAKVIPSFGNLMVATGVDDSGGFLLESPKRPMTIRDLTRHTSGLANSVDHPIVGTQLKELDPLNRDNRLADAVEKFSQLPLMFHPGEQWAYGPSVDVQAHIVERLSEMNFADYLDQNVLGPLKMNETGSGLLAGRSNGGTFEEVG